MSTAFRKVKSVAKDVFPKSKLLDAKVLKTMNTISEIVGRTLGPGGNPVLIERQEFGMPNLITKDGVTVFKALGFTDPVEHAVMEAARDAAIRTATEAGDGTTTATILSEAIVRYCNRYCQKNPKVSPQRIVRAIERIFRKYLEPKIKSLAIDVDDKLRTAVATCSANGDHELAAAVLKCFDVAGDDGSISIVEKMGPSGYIVDRLEGYPVAGIGYEDCCRRFFSVFINDKANNRVLMEKPVFLLYYGQINEIQVLLPILNSLGDQWERDKTKPHNVVVVASGGFSEQVLGQLSVNWSADSALNVFPMLVPKTPINNGDMHFLEDLQAITASPIYNPLSAPIERASVEELGPPLEFFEAHRYRSNVVGIADEGLQMARVEELKLQLENPEGELEARILKERLGKMTGGIAKLTISGSSAGEIREKRDRADDAACAIRGAQKHGCLPGAGWTLMRLVASDFELESSNDDIFQNVIVPALTAPVKRLMANAGLHEDEIDFRLQFYADHVEDGIADVQIWNGADDQFVNALQSGIIDSVPAVLEALRNAISIATLLGTLGGVVVFKRDAILERQEAADTMDFLRETEAPEAGTGAGGHTAIDL